MALRYSFIIPVYNRPEEVRELLNSFTKMHYKERYEIVIVEDGSTETAEAVIKEYDDQLEITYFFKKNSGPGASRNYGMERAQGTYYIILDSDVLMPPHYLQTVHAFLTKNYYPCFGGADAAHESFTALQKAINYVMTSFLTTGGIRGSKKSINSFEPRSFNMGISKEAFIATGGFGKIHPGEDPDLSQRIKKAGYKTTFIPNAYVFHKRRISWSKFHTQVKKFGMVRPILNLRHPEAAKVTFWLPTLFVVYCLFSLVTLFMGFPIFNIILWLYVGVVFVHSSFLNKNGVIGLLTIGALFVQFFGYGLAFLKSTYYINWLKKDPKKQFPELFFE